LDSKRRIMVAISGASGAIYARRLLEVLPRVYDTIYLTASDNALGILRDEIGATDLASLIPPGSEGKFVLLDPCDLNAPPASGSHRYDGLVAVPCSMGLVGRIASGVSNDLVTRAADVCLKERRKVVLVVRETPLSLIHLRNMTALTEAGAVVLPAAPAFYGRPCPDVGAGSQIAPQHLGIDDLVDFVVDRVLSALDLDIRLVKGWGE
jgi:flavin prenyltransferase